MGESLIVRRGAKEPKPFIIETGLIVEYYGALNTIPEGWALCEGTNDTPDLRNRFIVGAGSTYSVNATGGSANAIVVSHTHNNGTTNTTGNHVHSAQLSSNSSTATGWIFGKRSGTSFAGTHWPSSITGNHSHTVTINSTGSSATNANLPPYYGLFHIMKVTED